MKKTIFTKKLLSLLMAAVLVCVPLLLASCQTEEGDASNDTATLLPPTHAELFWDAICTLEEYFKPLETTFGMPLLSIVTNEADGTETATLSIDQLSAMGVSMIGNEPVRKEAVTKNKGGILNTVGTWFAGGDEIKFEEYSDETVKYLLLPGVQDSPFTTASGGNMDLLTDMEVGGIPNDILSSLESSVKELFTDEMILIAKSAEVDTYTITMDPETAKKFDEVLDRTMADSGLSDILGTGDLANDEGIDVSGGAGEMTMVLVLNVAAGKNYRLKLSTLTDGVETGVTRFDLSVNGAVTSLKYSVTEADVQTAQTDCTFTVAANNLKVELESLNNGQTTTADFTVTADAEQKLTYKGTINTSTQVEGMNLSVPITLNGTYHDLETSIVSTLSLSTSVAGLLEINLNTESTFVPGTPDVIAPQTGVDIKEIKMDELMAQMESTYPGATNIYNGLTGMLMPNTGNSKVEIEGTFFSGIEMTSLKFYDGKLEISGQGIWEEDDGEYIFYFGNNTVHVPYEIKDGVYYIFEADFAECDDKDNEGFEKMLRHVPKDGGDSIEIRFFNDSMKMIIMDMTLPYQFTESSLVITLPDGFKMSFPYSYDSENNGLTLGGALYD